MPLRVASLLAIAAYLLFLSRHGLSAYFTSDDGQNLVHLHGLWERSLGRCLLDALGVVTPAYRPVGGLLYRLLYAVFGYDPLPFRIACFVLLALNLVLAYRLAAALGGPIVAALATLAFAYHAALTDIYLSTGTVYDLLCFLFSMAAFSRYLTWRHTGRLREFALTAVCHAAALGSKEMAAVFPLVLALCEGLVLSAPRPPQRRWSLLGVLAAMSALSLTAKLVLPNDLSASPDYRLILSPAHLLANLARYLDLLAYANWFTPFGVTALVPTLAAVLLLLRQRLAVFGLLFFLVMLAPVLALPPRGGFVLYMPLWGASLAVAALAEHARRALLARLPSRWDLASRVALFAASLILLLAIHLPARNARLPAALRVHSVTRHIIERARILHPELPRGGRLLFLAEPYAAHDWVLLFLLRLRFDDPDLAVDRQKLLTRPLEQEIGLYDAVASYEEGTLRIGPNPARSRQPPLAVRAEPAVVRPGSAYTLTLPDLAGQALDVAFRLVTSRHRTPGVARDWCTLDASGHVTLRVPPDHPPATVLIEALRPQNGTWRPATGRVVVRP